MQRIIVQAGDTSAEAVALKKQYYNLRTRAFNACWGELLYPEGPDEYDKKAETTYVLYREDGQVITGLRLLFHRPGSEEKTWCEIKHPDFDLRELLPHLDVNALAYAELSGLVVDPGQQRSGKKLGTQALAGMLELVNTGAIKNGDVPIDVIVLSASKTGLTPMLRALATVPMAGIVRTDKIIREEDQRFQTDLWPILLSPKPGFQFLPPELTDKGVGVPIERFQEPERGTARGG